MFVWAAFFFDNKVRTPCQLVFQDGEYEAAAREVGLGCEVEWFPGGWMSRQRFAGRLGGKAEFPCGLTGGGGGRGASLSAWMYWALCCWLRGIGCFVVGLMGVGSLLL